MAPKRPDKSVLDLDALDAPRDEAESKGKTLRFRGQVFQLPTELPWEVVEGTAAAAEDRTGTTRALQALFGTEPEGPGPKRGETDERTSPYERFLALRPNLREVKSLFDHIFGLYDEELGESSASDAS